MILTVTPNPATDVTYTVPALVPGETNRVRHAHRRAGGKGVNVARVLTALGEPAFALTLGDVHADVPGEPVVTQGEPRHTVTVLSTVDGTATILNEPGATVDAAEWAALEDAVARRLADAAVLVLCGSLPPGAPPDGFARLGELGAARGVPVVLDTSGAALAAGLAARPVLVAPNAAELAGLGAEPGALAAEYGCAVAVTLGADGLRLVTADGAWTAHGAPVRGNPIGAGDACVAGFARGLARGAAPEDTVAEAVALAAAAVRGRYAGDVDLPFYRGYRVTVTPC